MKLQIGEKFLVTGPYLYEVATVVKVEKKRYTLDNNVVIDRDLNPLNTSNVKVKPFDKDEWELITCRGNLPKLIAKLGTAKIPDNKVVKLHNKLNKLLAFIEDSDE